MNKIQTKKGFTIIEVVLVLAIAGLIFLMVFLALPALQRSQRDTQRKNDASRLRAAVTDYTSNNRGSLPWAGANLKSDFISKYITTDQTSTFNDPSTNSEYKVTPASGATAAPTALGEMKLSNKAKCGTDGAIVAGNSIVVSVKTENGVANCVEG
ncbi:MAG: type II secretion system protein [bacterium]|nr:type II secretion system protein [bacterium]